MWGCTIFVNPREFHCRKHQVKMMCRIHAHEKECNVVSFNPFNETLFMSAASDSTVALWDARNTSHALHFLEGHTDGIYSGVWSPHQASVLATSGLDRRVIIWDLSRVGFMNPYDR